MTDIKNGKVCNPKGQPAEQSTTVQVAPVVQDPAPVAPVVQDSVQEPAPAMQERNNQSGGKRKKSKKQRRSKRKNTKRKR